MTKCVYPGSFNPAHLGHMHVILQASRHPGSAHYARKADRWCRVAYALEKLVGQKRIAIAHGMKLNIWRKS